VLDLVDETAKLFLVHFSTPRCGGFSDGHPCSSAQIKLQTNQ
jgi:hypothetical protein